MQSRHSIHWTPLDDNFVQTPSDSGRLYYQPARLSRALVTGPGYFTNRARRPHRIYIRHLAEEQSRQSNGSTSQLRVCISKLCNESVRRGEGKLATSRDSAKRFLRSLIASPAPASTPEDQESAIRSEGRGPARSRSWRGKRLSTLVEADNMRSSPRSSVAEPMPGTRANHGGRPSLSVSARPSSSHSATSACVRIPDEKPLASGNGVSVGISLAEPVLFLQGFEQAELAQRSTAMLRGSLHLRVTKSAKIRAVTLKFKGTAQTKWPEGALQRVKSLILYGELKQNAGIPPKKTETEETDTIMSHTWPFFNSQFPTAEFGSCADHVELTRTESPPELVQTSTKGSFVSSHSPFRRSPMNSATNLSKTAKSDNKRHSLQEPAAIGSTVAQKGYRTFSPGDYIYNFELPLDSHIPETIDVELGSVKYELEATIERPGPFKSNLVGIKEVVLIRTPAEGSLEQVEPIAISRNWEDQLHYDIVISGKSFPLGAQVPIAFKLTPLAKVQCHRVKVLVTENIEYYCNNKRVHRMGGTRKVQLFEKRADAPAVSTLPGSTMRVLTGGGLTYDQRAAAARGEDVVPPNGNNLLGDLESAGTNVGPTEMEISVQLPSCMNVKDNKESRLHFDTTYQNIQVHHWIKIVMRLSKPDTENPGKRRHFEISIDSPFHILSCRATQANIALPAYSSPQQPGSDDSRLYECGCPGAAPRSGSGPTSFIPTLNNLNAERRSTDEDRGSPVSATRTDSNESIPGLARPQAAHISTHNEGLQRPIHLMRAPSFNPPAFEDEEPPPPLQTPPPQYDTIASPTNGLADYFARLSDAHLDDDDGSDTDRETDHAPRTPGGGRLASIPLTPGGRVNRSMDEQRSWLPIGSEAR